MSQIGRKGKIRSYFIPYKRILKKTYISKTSGKGGGGGCPLSFMLRPCYLRASNKCIPKDFVYTGARKCVYI